MHGWTKSNAIIKGLSIRNRKCGTIVVNSFCSRLAIFLLLNYVTPRRRPSSSTAGLQLYLSTSHGPSPCIRLNVIAKLNTFPFWVSPQIGMIVLQVAVSRQIFLHTFGVGFAVVTLLWRDFIPYYFCVVVSTFELQLFIFLFFITISAAASISTNPV